jgi:hypothetical protein
MKTSGVPPDRGRGGADVPPDGRSAVDAAGRAASPVRAEPVVAGRAAAAPVVHHAAPVAPAVAVRTTPAIAGLTVAAARRTAPRPQPALPPAPALAVRRGVKARVTLAQVVCWQLAVVAVVLSLRQPVPVLVCGSAGAIVLVALTTVRVDGRWLYQRAALAAGYLCRTRRRDLPADAGMVPALLDLLVPGCAVGSIQTPDGPAMTTSHRGGVTALLRIRDAVATLPAPEDLLSRQDALGVQAVWTGPASVWLAVHAVRGVEASDDDELTLVLRNAVRRTRRALRRAGVSTEPLAGEAGRALIAGLAHVTGGRHVVREHWRSWRTGEVHQVAYRLEGSASHRHIAELCATGTGARVTVTVGARCGPGGPRVDGVLRIAATTEPAVEAALAVITACAEAHGIRLVRLDGAHARGVAASLPIGVFPT